MKTRSLSIVVAVLPLAFVVGHAMASGGPNTLRLSHSLSVAPAVSQQKPIPSTSNKRNTVADLLEESKSWMPGTASCNNLADQSRHLTLQATLQIVLCLHPRLVQARAQIEEQMADVRLSEMDRRPDVQTILQYSTEKDRQANFTDATRKGVSVGLSASWVLFDFGQQSANIRAANLQLQSMIASQRSVSLAVLREALEQYINASTTWANLIAAQKTLKIAQKTEEFARARYLSKVGNQIDQLQAQTAVHQAELALVVTQGEWQDARAALAVAMGLSGQEDLTMATSEPDLTFEAPDLTEKGGDLSKLLLEHPDVQTLQSQIQALEERREASRASYLGQVSVDLFTGRVNEEIAGLQASRTNAVGNIRASIPLFTSGVQQQADQKLLNQQIAVQAAQQEAIRALQTELLQARQGVQLSRSAYGISDQLMHTAERAQEIALGRFKAGVGSIIELLDAQAALTNARRQQANSRADALRQQVRLLLVSGQLGLTGSH